MMHYMDVQVELDEQKEKYRKFTATINDVFLGKAYLHTDNDVQDTDYQVNLIKAYLDNQGMTPSLEVNLNKPTAKAKIKELKDEILFLKEHTKTMELDIGKCKKLIEELKADKERSDFYTQSLTNQIQELKKDNTSLQTAIDEKIELIKAQEAKYAEQIDEIKYKSQSNTTETHKARK